MALPAKMFERVGGGDAPMRHGGLGIEIRGLVRKHNITEQTFYRWRNKYGGMDVSDARKLKALEDENTKLKRLLADAMLDNAVLKDIAAKKW